MSASGHNKKEYDRMLPMYKRLRDAAEAFLINDLKSNSIESLTEKRVKELSSIVEKAQRKNLSKPFDEIKDIVGLRIKYLYPSDLSVIKGVIEKNFKILEMENKKENLDPKVFDYLATHYIVKINPKVFGTHYNDIKDIPFEIQVRTYLQDLWAVVSHKLAYKKDKQLSGSTQRKLSRIAGLFELVDEQFEVIRSEAEHENKNLSKTINEETVSSFLKRKIPQFPLEFKIGLLARFMGFFKACKLDQKYSTISDLEKALNQTEKARNGFGNDPENNYIRSATGELQVALSFLHDEFFNIDKGWNEPHKQLYDKYRFLIESD